MTDWLLNKSAKQWVNELGVKMLVQPKWETREAVPGQHPPTFLCTCTITFSDKQLKAEGKGSTKKSAEQEAALEMLTKGLKQTPKSILELSMSSKSKTSSSSSSSSASSPAGSQGDVPVSDTDDDACKQSEIKSGFNPISELASICSLYEEKLGDPDYEDVKTEGPPHKRVFTVNCSLSSLGLSENARRPTKKLAKRIAAFRVLRQVKAKGFQYSSQRDMDVEIDADIVEIRSPSKMEDVEISMEGLSLYDKHLETGNYKTCPDKSGDCVANCVDYLHAFKHLDASPTMDALLASPLVSEVFQAHGGGVKLLDKLVKELDLQVAVHSVSVNGLYLTFVQVKLPFHCKFSVQIPDKVTFHSLAPSEEVGREEASVKAVQSLRSFMITVDN